MSLTEVLDDLRAERADLRARVDAGSLEARTPAAGWDVRDVVAHLIGFDVEAATAAAEPERFTAGLAGIVDVEAFMQGHLDRRRSATRAELLAEGDAAFAALVTAVAAVPPGTRVPWYGPPMSAMSCATARLMEYWAHGQDVVDAYGQVREPTDRLHHVCHLGVRTRAFSYAVRGLPVPDADVRVELSGPGGGTWGEGPDVVRGTALDFALLVTQRRHRSDLHLVATGPAADSWLDVAQCFAGPPTTTDPGRTA